MPSREARLNMGAAYGGSTGEFHPGDELSEYEISVVDRRRVQARANVGPSATEREVWDEVQRLRDAEWAAQGPLKPIKQGRRGGAA